VGSKSAGSWRVEKILRARGADVITTFKKHDIKGILRELALRGIQSVLLEGGSKLQAAAWDEDVVDYVQLYVTPVALGPRGVPLFEGRHWPLSSLIDSSVKVLGPDTLIEGYVHRPH
jgi:diaminohydroxyphosphoribosylaminopyrimidine deaminase/5-amino-6-(5-phosphoribosylamino)uracil reductase